MTEKPLTHKQALATVIQALGGTWDTERAVLALRVAGYEPTSDEAAGKGLATTCVSWPRTA
ncbi:hypothetical protein PV729_21720 [Streptomyces europaeiscabiei]|uniref:Uncharacterized protein n=1 Tax=Streptomyces europaeiscabiei TaxID=146819 RepID=A0ABU4N8L0_9ACTN|nr:hypothetical protein [Streptomyces europaeiscabiei]MDX3545367.1 hypothetical protein [Streptomyces europaeiscabiei]MDX3554358.1 hypothetical protein [Streptomyces europaeiscabiei]MDX3699391.1 hypothetical protein [Streptomyces europaeiscabiei]